MYGSKPTSAVFRSTARDRVLSSLTLSSSKTLARTFAAAFPVIVPFVV